MIGRIDRDETEEKLCNNYRYGMKQKSYKLGLVAGKLDSKNKKNLEKKAKCPFKIPSDILILLKKRARWFAGYDYGWQISLQKRLHKDKKKR